MVIALAWMAERKIRIDYVAVACANPMALDVPGVFQVVDDAVRRTLGDADTLGNVAQSHLRIACQAEKHMRVVGEEGPAAHASSIGQ